MGHVSIHWRSLGLMSALDFGKVLPKLLIEFLLVSGVAVDRGRDDASSLMASVVKSFIGWNWQSHYSPLQVGCLVVKLPGSVPSQLFGVKIGFQVFE